MNRDGIFFPFPVGALEKYKKNECYRPVITAGKMACLKKYPKYYSLRNTYFIFGQFYDNIF